MSKEHEDLEYTITELIPNSNMGGNECICKMGEHTGILYIDKHNWIKVGDVIRIERNEHGSYVKMWINGTGIANIISILVLEKNGSVSPTTPMPNGLYTLQRAKR